MFDAPRRNFAIVIVDDSRHLVSVYEKFFETAGLDVVAKFYSGKELLTSFAGGKSDLEKAIILLDHAMPEMDGIETAKKVKKLNPSQRIVLAVVGDLTRIKIDQDLFVGTILKPFTLSELIKTIERISSSIRAKGSQIFSDPEQIENMIRDIVSESKEKMCSVRNPSMIRSGVHLKGHTSTYISAISKGLKVFVVTEINNENLAYCKQLMLNRGVHLRHLEGAIPNFAIWDEKHMMESVQIPSESAPYGHVLYSNLESDVNRNQYLFEYFWNIARPAKDRIRELEASSDQSKSTVITGYDEWLRIRMKILREAQVSLEICSVPEVISKIVIPSLGQDHRDTIKRGVRFRYLFDISMNSIDSAQKLMDVGIEVQHLPNSSSVFAASEKAYFSIINAQDLSTGAKIQAVYSTEASYIEQHRSIFEALWNSAKPAIDRIKEITEENQGKELERSKHNRVMD